MTKSQHTNILFLARRYPPSIGGIETHCYELHRRLTKQANVRLVALRRRSLANLIWFLPYCLWTTFWTVLLRKADVVYFADGVVGFIAPIVRFLGPARFCITIYGLEMTYKNPLARLLMKAGARACEKVVVISENTKLLTEKSGVPNEKLSTIYLGVEPNDLSEEKINILQKNFEKQHAICLGQERVLLMFGRQVRRKGMAEFIEHGMPLLDKDIKLIIGGDGIEAKRITAVVERCNLSNRVIQLGIIPNEQLIMLRHRCDLFLMPNIKVQNDVEGFGQTQLECMYSGMPVIAFAVDALTESVREGGFLIKPNDYIAFVNKIHSYYKLGQEQRIHLRQSCRNYVRGNYTWDVAAKKYMEIFEKR